LSGFNFSVGPLCLRDFDTARAAPDNIGADAPFDNCLTRLNASMALVVSLYHPIGDDFFFADMDLRLFLSRQRGPNAGYFIVFERALSLAASHP
jgi:hypothetical protein